MPQKLDPLKSSSFVAIWYVRMFPEIFSNAKSANDE